MCCRDTMPLPVLKDCCGCLALELGCKFLSVTSAILCIIAITFGSWQLPAHKTRRNEDNVLIMSLVMFSSLSLISNIVILIGVIRNRASHLQLSLLSNSVFILCLFLVTVVACMFSPTLYSKLFIGPGYVVLTVFLVAAGAAYSSYFLIVVNSTYIKLRTGYSSSAIPI